MLDDWGFRRRLPRGQGVAVLFAGPPGTGKTMAAEAIADALEQDLYRIDLSAVVSKYIGETEKNLATAFDEAERAGAVLFFDEADALFGKRTEVRDAHDRYANLEVNYLLQRVETFTGLVVLASNREAALDEAFLRRLRFIVRFELPDARLRKRLWQRSFPPEAAHEGLDWDALARGELSGGNIQSAALAAAYLARRRRRRDHGPSTSSTRCGASTRSSAARGPGCGWRRRRERHAPRSRSPQAPRPHLLRAAIEARLAGAPVARPAEVKVADAVAKRAARSGRSRSAWR